MEPSLPPDIERYIADILALEEIQFPVRSKHCCLNLQLTAHRFHDWLLPHLFNVIFIQQGRRSHFPSTDHLPKHLALLKKYGNHTRKIKCYSPTWLNAVLPYCPNVEDVVLWPSSSSGGSDTIYTAHPTIQMLSNLKRLSGTVGKLTKDDFLSPVYLGLTHLDIIGNMEWDLLTHLKYLTHLCFSHPPEDLAHTVGRLSEHDRLRVVIALRDSSRGQFKDPRLVLLRELDESDWELGANGGMDFWEFAERIVLAREAGFIRNKDPSRVFRKSSFKADVELTIEGQIWWCK
ncbi:hypothetical protein CVT24_001109 [Panaeolus cyanescens]|uniref:F-box domain-containing protein n=1 Tax=Panaeolus cyanescens TaxID=181874 RepID=A0A409W6W6_9AGAR|nr:hypothetical protein CVT24_001109 [Panaeolus cyanescens]